MVLCPWGNSRVTRDRTSSLPDSTRKTLSRTVRTYASCPVCYINDTRRTAASEMRHSRLPSWCQHWLRCRLWSHEISMESEFVLNYDPVTGDIIQVAWVVLFGFSFGKWSAITGQSITNIDASWRPSHLPRYFASFFLSYTLECFLLYSCPFFFCK